MTKVIHVHLLNGRRNYYFGSLSAVFDVLTEEDIGMKRSSLMHAGLADGGCVLTRKAMIRQDRLIRASKEGNRG